MTTKKRVNYRNLMEISKELNDIDLQLKEINRIGKELCNKKDIKSYTLECFFHIVDSKSLEKEKTFTVNKIKQELGEDHDIDGHVLTPGIPPMLIDRITEKHTIELGSKLPLRQFMAMIDAYVNALESRKQILKRRLSNIFPNCI